MAPSPSHCLPQKRIHSPLELISTWPHRHPPSSVQSQPSDRYPSTSQGPQTLLPFHEGSVPSPVITLSEKSANTYSGHVFQPVVFQGTPSAKVRQSLRQPKASPANRLCNLEDGRAMQSTFISTTFPNHPSSQSYRLKLPPSRRPFLFSGPVTHIAITDPVSTVNLATLGM